MMQDRRPMFAGLQDPKVLALIASAVVLNFAGGEVIKLARIPVYGDSVGTMLVGLLAGPWIGAVGGVVSNLVLGLRDPNMPFFAPVSLVIGALAGAFARAGFFRVWRGAAADRAQPRAAGPLAVVRQRAGPIVAGLVIGVAAACVATPIAAYVYGGVTGGPTDVLFAIFRSYGAEVWKAVLGQSVISDPIDKLATALLAFAIVSALPRRTVAGFPNGPRLLGAGSVRGGDGGDGVDDVDHADFVDRGGRGGVDDAGS